jgi:hypothetical protein
MNVDAKGTDMLRSRIASGNFSELKALSVDSISIFAACELACIRRQNEANSDLLKILDSWAETNPKLRAAFDTFVSFAVPDRRNPWSSREWEFFPTTLRAWDSNDHHLFESRFTQGCKQAGFSSTALALAGAFREMADNTIQHSGPNANTPATGIIGYEIECKTVSFAVADVGRGILASLKQNPEWAALADSPSALEAAVVRGASRRSLAGPGGGFKELFKALASLQGVVRVRSEDGEILITGRPKGTLSETMFMDTLKGVQLEVICSTEKRV